MMRGLVKLFKKGKKAECVVCGKEHELYDLFCLLEFMKATKVCVKSRHPLICRGCMENVREFFLEGDA